MDVKRTAIIGAAALAVAGGGGAAVAAISGEEGRKAEGSIINNAAKRLDVQPDALRGALSAAEDDQLDEAVRNGDLTRRQADRIKRERRRSGRVLGHPGGPPGFGPGGPHGPGGPGFRRGGPRRGPLADVARALGITRRKLFAELRDGKTLAQIARAEGKDLDDVRASVKAAVKRRLDRAVANENLTRRQADRMLDHLDEHLDRLGARGFERGGRFRGRGPGGPPPGFGPGGPPPPMR